jgi:hypothetical protein
VTDCARISLEFATAQGLKRAAKFVLQSASTFENRVANPTDEGYRDLMFTVLIEGHVCEVSERLAAPRRPFCCPAACSAPHRTLLAWDGELWPGAGERGGALAFVGRAGVGGGQGGVAGRPRVAALSRSATCAAAAGAAAPVVEMIKAKKSGAGHRMYKVCRRVLMGPIVKEDTYCASRSWARSCAARGRSQRAGGAGEGRGTMVYPTAATCVRGAVAGGQAARAGQVHLRHR